jgi:hypothetical protein
MTDVRRWALQPFAAQCFDLCLNNNMDDGRVVSCAGTVTYVWRHQGLVPVLGQTDRWMASTVNGRRPPTRADGVSVERGEKTKMVQASVTYKHSGVALLLDQREMGQGLRLLAVRKLTPPLSTAVFDLQERARSRRRRDLGGQQSWGRAEALLVRRGRGDEENKRNGCRVEVG